MVVGMEINVGLEGVPVAATEMSMVNGQEGRLILRGYAVERLAGQHTFEEVVGLFLDGAVPSEARRAEIVRRLAEERVLAYERIPKTVLEAGDGMDALRAGVALLFETASDETAQMLQLVAAVGVVGAAWSRAHRGLAPLPPDATRRHAEDLLRMVTGSAPTPAKARGLDTYLGTVVDHGMNASTFAARVVASTESDPVSAVVAAIGALKGRLHGGAPGPVLDMLDAIGAPEEAEAWLEKELERGRRIMGMGHRVYRVRDPRAAVLERAVSALEDEAPDAGRLALARATERAAEALLARRHPDRALRANVEFYTAVLLEALDIPRTMFTPTFAAARTVGWVSHVFEQRRTGRLIRPASRYVGPMDCAPEEA